MHDKPIRLQGGVFIWLCAVFVAGVAACSIWSLCSGVGELLFSAGCSYGVFLGAYRVFKKLILWRAGSVEGEQGPLLGITIATVACFLLVYFKDIHVVHSGSDASCFLSLLRALAGCVLFGAAVWMVAKGLNRRNLDLRYGILTKMYADLTEGAQVAFISFTVLASLLVPVVFTGLALGVDGLRLLVWTALGHLVISSAVCLVLLSWSRHLFFTVFTSIVQSAEDRCFNPHGRKDLWDDDFSLCEICSAVTSGSLVALLFMVCPRWLESHYFQVMFCGMAIAYAVEIILVLGNKARCNEDLRGRWRNEVKSMLLNADGGAQERKRVELIKARVVARLDFTSLGEWLPDAQLLMTSERLRKLLNYHFCEDGRMRYLNSAVMEGKGCAYRRQAEIAIDEMLPLRGPGGRYDDVTDEELEALCQRLCGEGEIALSAEDGELVETCVRRLQQTLAEMELQPYSTLSAEFARKAGEFQMEFKIEASGKVYVCSTVGEMASCDLDGVLETVETILKTRGNMQIDSTKKKHFQGRRRNLQRS